MVILRVNSKSLTRGRLLSIVKGKVGASRVSRLTHLWKEEKSLISLLTARKPGPRHSVSFYAFMSSFEWIKGGQKFIKTYIVHCTVVTGWYYCYYPVSGTRPHYEWVGFFAHHVGLKSFQKQHFFLDSTWTRFLLKTRNHNSKLVLFFVPWEHTSNKLLTWQTLIVGKRR